MQNYSWGSRLGFILAAAGSAVGLGAIWKFPYMAGTNGGAAFMLPYIFFMVTVGVVLLLAEYTIGRAGRKGPVSSFTAVCGKGWGFIGAVGTLTVFLILSFYSVVGGWCLKYLIDAVMGSGMHSSAEELNAYFGGFVSNPTESYAFLLLFLFVTALVVLRGVSSGIERAAKILMPLLFILMLVMIVRGVTLPGGWEGVRFLFEPKWELMTRESLFNAMGFCFFSLSIGAGVMVTYGSYLANDARIVSSSVWVSLLAVLCSILGGLMVMPVVFAVGLDPTAGPGLTFVTMPAIFAQMPFGQLFSIIFYICLAVAALTSSVSMLEACTSLLCQELHMDRFKAAITVVIAAAVVGFFANMAMGPWADVKFFGKNFFDLLDFLTSNVGMPVASFGAAVGATWVAWESTRKQLSMPNPLSSGMLTVTRVFMGVIAPLFVLIVAGGGWFG